MAEIYSAANVNPHTGLATDYLNHFNEAVMLLELIPDMPECIEDFLAWQPRGYREHFETSDFAGREVAIAAYEAAEPALRTEFDRLTHAMTSVLETAGLLLRDPALASRSGIISTHVAESMKPLVLLAGGLINGDSGDGDVESILAEDIPDFGP